MKLDDRLIVLNDDVLGTELGALRKHLTQLGESTFDKGLLAEVVTGKWVRPLHNPIHVVGHMREEGSPVAVLKSLKDFANTFRCNCHLNLSFSFVICQSEEHTSELQSRSDLVC